jgi:hypothetical protein
MKALGELQEVLLLFEINLESTQDDARHTVMASVCSTEAGTQQGRGELRRGSVH